MVRQRPLCVTFISTPLVYCCVTYATEFHPSGLDCLVIRTALLLYIVEDRVTTVLQNPFHPLKLHFFLGFISPTAKRKKTHTHTHTHIHDLWFCSQLT